VWQLHVYTCASLAQGQFSKLPSIADGGTDVQEWEKHLSEVSVHVDMINK